MKTLKLPLFIAITLFGIGMRSITQAQPEKTSGLYLTPDDYLNHKLSYEVNPGNPTGNKLYLHEFLGQKKVTVVANGKRMEFLKSQIFGYHDSNNQDYRFFGSVAYQIVDKQGFYLYSFDKLIQQGKGPKPTRTFYFSIGANTGLLLLTQGNIDKAFAANQKFRYLVQAEFKSDNELEEYDNIVNQYKIKELFAQSSK